MNLQEQIELLENQKKALSNYIEMCIFIKAVPKPEILMVLEDNTSIEKLQEAMRMFEETKEKYTKAIQDV